MRGLLFLGVKRGAHHVTGEKKSIRLKSSRRFYKFTVPRTENLLVQIGKLDYSE